MSLQSRYSCIWHKLKKEQLVKISAPAAAHIRLRKAIIKRKDVDLGFKLEMAEQHLRPHLSFKSEGNILTVKLHLPVRSSWL